MQAQAKVEYHTIIKRDGRVLVALRDADDFTKIISGTSQPPKSSKLADFPEFLSVDELAEAVGRHKKTIYRAFQRGQLPGARKIGGVIAIRKDVFLRAWETGSLD